MQIDDNLVDTTPSDTTAEAVSKVDSDTTEAVDTDDTEIDEHGKPVKSKVQARIDEITKARRQAERERDYYRDLATKQEQVTTSQKPRLEDFDYDTERYQEALVDWKVEERLSRSKIEESTRESRQAEMQVEVGFKTRENAFRTEYPDYDAVAYNPNNPVTPVMAKAIKQDDNGAVVAYFLGKNPDVAFRIANLKPHEQFIAISDLSDRIAEHRHSRPQEQEEPSIPVTAAPEPIKGVVSRGAVKSVSLDKITDTDAWMKARNAQLNKR